MHKTRLFLMSCIYFSFPCSVPLVLSRRAHQNAGKGGRNWIRGCGNHCESGSRSCTLGEPITDASQNGSKHPPEEGVVAVYQRRGRGSTVATARDGWFRIQDNRQALTTHQGRKGGTSTVTNRAC